MRPSVPEWRPANPDASWWRTRTPEELEALRIGGRRYYEDAVQDRNPTDGKRLESRVLVMVPHGFEKAGARVDALQHCAVIMGRKGERITIAEAVATLGATYWEHIDTITLLSHCLFDPIVQAGQEPQRHALPELLDRWYTTASLYQVYQHLDYWQTQEDPRIQVQSEAELLELAHAVAKDGTCAPLVDIDGSALERFIVFIAKRLQSAPTPSASSP